MNWWSLRPGPAREAAKRAAEETPKAPLFPLRDRYRGPRNGAVSVEGNRVIADPGRPYQRVYYFGNEAHKELAIIAATAGLPYELLNCKAVVDGNMVQVFGPNGSVAGFFRDDLIAAHQATYDLFAERENAHSTPAVVATGLPTAP